MEKVQSLFNKLETALKNNAPADLLLNILGQMQDEVKRTSGVETGVGYQNGVAVLLPNGYLYSKTASETCEKLETYTIAEPEMLKTAPAEVFTLELSEMADAQPKPEPTEEDEISAFLAVPRPPKQINLEFPLFEEEKEDTALEPVKPEVFNMPFEEQRPEVFIPAAFVPLSKSEEVLIEESIEADGPIVFELEVPEELKSVPENVLPDFFGRRKTDVGEPFTDTLTQNKTKELHEILAERVVAKPASSPMGLSKGLSEMLGATKISDLRKAITINDKFRFINGLFNGDEVFFERAVKTINSFTVLQEAQYWIQRELTIKNGWNDEDELVQQFYQLVNRRFL